MSLIAPLALLLGLLAVPIVLLYMLRLRRRDFPVSSTMLWQRLLRDREANAPWQRLRRNLLLLLQLLILALLVFALARPYLPVSAVTSGSVVVLLDGSASMLAREADTERFDLARREVERIIDNLSGDSSMTLILVGSTPRVLVSGSQDRVAIREALAQAQATPVSADWPAAMALAAGAAQGFQDGRIILVSDGGLAADLPPMPVEVIYLPVGSATENLAISALSSRDSQSALQLFASVTNHGQMPQRALFNLSLDGQLFDARRIDVAADDTVYLTWEVSTSPALIEARLSEATQDRLAWDDQRWTVHESGRQSRVLLLTEGNRFLETALAVIPGLEVFKADPETGLAGLGDGDYDLLVADSVTVPQALPATDMLIINPLGPATDQASEAGPTLGTANVFTRTEIIRLEDNPLLRYVDWSDVNVRAAREVAASWARPLVQAEGGPLLLAGERDGRRAVILAFSLQDSDMPLQIAFPIVMANIVDWLDPGGPLLGAADVAPNEPVNIRIDSGAETVVVRKPDGVSWIHDAEDTSLVFADTDQIGVYEVWTRNAEGERSAGQFTVNLTSASESRITPATSVQVGLESLREPGLDNVGQREYWPWLAGLALVVLVVEWWIYHRGTRLPIGDVWHNLTGRLRVR